MSPKCHRLCARLASAKVKKKGRFNMLLKTKPKPKTTWIVQNSPELVTPYRLSLILAYLQYYTPKRLQNGRFLPIQDLRNLANRIGHPLPKLNSLKQHKILSMHFVLLQAAQFISAKSAIILPQPATTRWLHLPHQEAIDHLLSALNDPDCWQQACADLALEKAIDVDSRVYLQQSFSRQREQQLPEMPQNLQWLETEDEAAWHFHVPRTLPLWLQFDLRQLGEWVQETELICTPLTIATANQRGYSPETIIWLLETGTQENLSSKQKQQLQEWSRRANAYKLQSVQLLSTAQPAQMGAILRQKRLRKHVIQHLSPRHAVVSTAIAPQLEKWLQKQHFPLKQENLKEKEQSAKTDIEENMGVALSEQTAVQWLGTRVLIGLSELTHQPIPSPYSLLEQIEGELNENDQSELEAVADKLLNGLREAIRGRDAFLPARQPVPQAWLDLVKQAIWDDTSLQIQYRPLGSRQPSWREVQPLRLEQRGGLYYLFAYCLRAETNLTFRLDRIHDIGREERREKRDRR